ncbi:MAG: hypothetical protein HRU20_13350 [Pseudomonadales bacterium]|nr:hypothetical protein [Pseudomonadales bacterium]
MMVKEISRACPRCGAAANRVNTVTMRHHLQYPFSADSLDKEFFYCRDSLCESGYFSTKQAYPISELQSQAQIRGGMICFCFGITASDFQVYQESDQAEVFFKQLDHLAYNCECHCKIKNPAGRGCLKVFKSMHA